MRLLVSSIVLPLALLAGCSKPAEEDRAVGAKTSNMDIREQAAPAAMAPPDISPHAAPGVAFNYRYAFVLPSKAISVVQEQHAAACEKLGPTQCRITGMHYSLVDEDKVSASLSFKLAPELARAYGKDGIAAVAKAGGKLVDAAIEGEDVGTQITDSQRRSASARSELARIEQQLAAGGIKDVERAELQQQAEQLRQQIASESQTRTEGEERLANTPMTFNYTGDEGFTLGKHPFGDAAQSSWDSLTRMISLVLLTFGVLLPWLLLAAVLLALWRSPPGQWLRRKVRGKPKAAPAAPGEAPPQS